MRAAAPCYAFHIARKFLIPMEEMIVLQTHIDSGMDALGLDIATPIITICGNTLDGTPVQVRVTDYLPYFYVQCTAEISISALEKALTASFNKGKCMGVERTMRQSIYGYSEAPQPFYKVYFNTPFCFRAAKALFEAGLSIDGGCVRFKVFESGFPLVLRFMNDMNITGMSYVRIKNYEVASRHESGTSKPLVVSTTAEFVEPLPLSGEYMKILPLKILSFDIECCGDDDSFPAASKDPVIQIGNTIQRFGESTHRQDIFCLHETAGIPGAGVSWFDSEKDMLVAWRDFLLREDPDIIIGYNIKGFDFPYLMDRAELLGIKDFGRLGRTDRVSRVVVRQQASSAFGAFDAKEITIDGRLIFDLLHVVRRDYRLRSYSLNSVSFHFLNEQKEDVSYSSMHLLQAGTPDTRRRIASYCLRDTYLPMRLFDKLNVLVNHSELSRATRVPVEYFSTRGSAIKVLTQIYYEAGRAGFLIPDMDSKQSEDRFEGAFVMEPDRGYYADPIAVLDFSSLYPSIIISKNMCYTTLLSKEQSGRIEGVRSPTGDCFCAARVKEGLLPRILRNLLEARKETRRQLREVKDPYLARALNGRQIALKVCANSIYGFTGSYTGQLPCIEISQSTTAFGREMIVSTKKLIEENFCMAQGQPFDTHVIYGDTDSVMVNFIWRENAGRSAAKQAVAGDAESAKMAKENEPNEQAEARVAGAPQGLEWVFDSAREIARFVSATFEKPVSLEFEKVYCPYLLMNKKRYAGLVHTNPTKPDGIDTKGIETVRRDNCELVKNVVQTCLDRILINKDIDGAVRYVKETVRDLYTERIDLSQLVISKTFTKTNYASKQTHSELAERLRRRGATVGIGDRIPYVIVKGDKKMLTHEKSEDPVYVLEHNLPIDKEYYIEQQLSKPLQRLFEPIMDNVSSLFSGEHTKTISQSVSMAGPMNAFVKTLEECVGCRRAGSVLCTDCRKDFPRHYVAMQRLYNEKAQQYNACWVQCQRCQGSILNEVLCVNRICPIWYKRTKVKKEIGSLQTKIDKLDELSW